MTPEQKKELLSWIDNYAYLHLVRGDQSTDAYLKDEKKAFRKIERIIDNIPETK